MGVVEEWNGGRWRMEQGHTHLESVPHEGPCVQDFVERGHSSDDDLRAGLHALKKHVDPILQELRQLVGGEAWGGRGGREGGRRIMYIGTGEAISRH